MQKIGSKYTMKRTNVYSIRAEIKSLSISLFNLSWKKHIRQFKFSLLCTYPPMIVKASKPMIWGLENKF